MTNAKQIKGLFLPLLQRNDDLIQIDRFSVWIKPIRHVVCRVTIDSTSDPDLFDPDFSLTPIYWEMTDFKTGPGSYTEDFGTEPPLPKLTVEYRHQPKYWTLPDYIERLAILQARRQWRWSDPEIPRIFLTIVETEILPLLRRMAQDNAAYAAYHRTDIVPDGRAHVVQRWAVALAAGALDEAREIQAVLMRSYEVDRYGDYQPPDPIVWPRNGERKRGYREAYVKAIDCVAYRRRRHRFLEVAEPLRLGDRAAIAAALHRWEAEAVRSAYYERWWEPTPFPIEEG